MKFKLWLETNELLHTDINLAKVDVGQTTDFTTQDTAVIPKKPQRMEVSVPNKGDVVIVQVGVKTKPKEYEVKSTMQERGRTYLVIAEKRSKWGKFRDDLILGLPSKNYTLVFDPKNFKKTGSNTWQANNPIV